MGLFGNVVRKAFKSFKISDTERQALESGTVELEKELLSGKPNWEKIFSYDYYKLTEEEQNFLDNETEQLCAMLDDYELENSKAQDLPQEVWDFLKQHKFLGMVIPKEHGGLGFSANGHAAVITKIASRSITGAVTVMVPNSLGPGELIYHYGTDDQKKYFLPRLANSEEIPCFGLTNPHAGSDAANIPDNGIVFKDENGDIKIKLNFEKRYITLAPIASLVGLAFHLHDPDNLLGKGKYPGITVALVKRDTEGMEIGRRHRPMNLAFMNGPIVGKDVVISPDDIIGGQDMAGQGWRMLMESLGIGRNISLPSMSVASAQVAAYATGAYARVRDQFGTSIGNFGGVWKEMGQIAGMNYLMEALRKMGLDMVDAGEKPSVTSAISKYHLTEGMRDLVNKAMDIQAGKAVIQGPSNMLGRVYQGVPVAITVEGANIMTRNLMIFGQGGVRAHPHLLNIMNAVDKEKTSGNRNKDVDRHASKFVYGTIGSVFGSFFGGGGSVPKRFRNSPVKQYFKDVNRLSRAFNFVSNIVFASMGDKLKFKEEISARMGDVLSYLTMATATLRRFEEEGRCPEDLPMVHWACQYSLHKAENAFYELFQNYPSKNTGKFMSMISRTGSGRKYPMPSDKLEKQCADALFKPGAARNNLTTQMYKPPTQSGEILADLEQAFEMHCKMEEDGVFEAVRKHQKEGSEIPADLQKRMDEFAAIQLKIITVDSYTKDGKLQREAEMPAPKPKVK